MEGKCKEIGLNHKWWFLYVFTVYQDVTIERFGDYERRGSNSKIRGTYKQVKGPNEQFSYFFCPLFKLGLHFSKVQKFGCSFQVTTCLHFTLK